MTYNLLNVNHPFSFGTIEYRPVIYIRYIDETKICIGAWNARTTNETSKLARRTRYEKKQIGYPRG